MSEAVVKLAKNRKPPPDKGQEQKLSPNEAKALAKIQQEAKENGATLATEGKGGLPPSTVLGVFRKHRWRCPACGLKEDLSIHHKAGTPNLVSRALRKKGHSNDPSNLSVLCAKCHDNIHEKDRDAEQKD